MANTKISCFGNKVYIGIDVHKETYSVTCICDSLIVKKAASIPANPAQFAQSILNWFKDRRDPYCLRGRLFWIWSP